MSKSKDLDNDSDEILSKEAVYRKDNLKINNKREKIDISKLKPNTNKVKQISKIGAEFDASKAIRGYNLRYY